MNDETGLGQQALIVPDRGEEEKTDGASNADLVIRQLPGHNDGIGKEHAAAWAKHAMPISQDIQTAGKVVDRIVAEDGVK